MPNLQCSICKTAFYRKGKRYLNNKSGKIFCSPSCFYKFNQRENHGNWVNGINKSGNGYLDIKNSFHPMADKRGRIAVHRYIMSNHVKRSLNAKEIVHHIDGNKLNNDISNLKIVTRAEHVAIHGPSRRMAKYVKCLLCTGSFYCYPHLFNKRKFCSKECYGDFMRSKPKNAMSKNLPQNQNLALPPLNLAS